MILYPFPDSISSFDDYRHIPDLSGLDVTSEIELIENLYSVLGNAFSCHSELLSNCIYDDIVTLKTDVFLALVRSMSSGRIASIIGSNKYSDTDRATENAIKFIMEADPEQIEQLNVFDVDSVVRNCFSGSLKAGQY